MKNSAVRGILRLDPIIIVLIIVTGIISISSYRHQTEDGLPVTAPAKTAPTISSVAPAIIQSQPAATSVQQGHLAFEDGFYDFGDVAEGDVVRHTFKFRNDGFAPLRIVKTETSCGCTTAKGALKQYAPGESGEMEVVVDTVGKKGIIVKTVKLTLDGSSDKTSEISVTMSLVPPPHPKKEKLANLNADSRCKTCHLENGQGQTGIFLFHRVCAQCHGKKGAGATARALNDRQWQKTIKDDFIRKRITDGWSERGMPSFVKGVTPPLDNDQVVSLIQYIRKLGNETE